MQKVSAQDLLFMRQAIRLAKTGLGCVHPNPLVGALLVRRGKILSRGAHEFFGGPHAEVNALSKLKQIPKDCTLYVTLEPCAHQGKTPPCADFIINHKIKRVVIGATDPNPLVSGKGIRRLKARGIEVLTGIVEKEARDLNKDFAHWICHRTPYVTVKVAQTLDGKIATDSGESKWISGESSRRVAHDLRAKSDAVLVGINTILNDDPRLNVRLSRCGRQPWRIVLDSYLKTPRDARLFSKTVHGGPVLIVTGSHAPKAKRKFFEKKAKIWVVKETRPGRVDWRDLLKRLGREGIVNLLIEGGGEVIGSALQAKVVHEMYLFVAPKILGGKGAVSSTGNLSIASLKNAIGIQNLKTRSCGEDLLIHGIIQCSQAS